MTMAINNITLSGYLGDDCIVRSTPNSKLIATFPLAVKQGYGEHQKTSWVQCRLFGLKAEKLPVYLKCGTKVTVTGSFMLEHWTDKHGSEKTGAVVLVNGIDFFTPKQIEQCNSLTTYVENPPKNPVHDEEIPF